MTLAPEKLRLLTFPQRVTATTLDLRLMLVPTQSLLYVGDDYPSQLAPGTTVRLPRFIAADLALAITTTRGLGGYPYSDPAALALEGVTSDTTAAGVAFPPGLPALYEGLAARFDLDLSRAAATVPGAGNPRPDAEGIRKYLPGSYRQAFNFTRPRTPYAVIDDSYHCAIHRSPAPDPLFRQSGNEVTWGRVIALCLRQPLLAERLGLIHRVSLPLPAPGYFADGGWAWCDLASPLAEFDITSPDLELRRYAARIPPIEAPRQVFAALQFPVVKEPPQPNGSFDTLKIEAADYDDGFAKIVHAAQPVSTDLLAEVPDGQPVRKDIGIRLGWDDEQLLIWQNRQWLADPATPGKRLDAPLGVFAYRLDVREQGAAAWESLARLQGKARLALAGLTIAEAGTPQETGVQVFPSKLDAGAATRHWLPSFFTQWHGASLVLPDARAAALDASGALANPGAYSDANIPKPAGQQGGLYEPLLPVDTVLKYGHAYEFRVRLADLAGGGPGVDDDALNEAPAPGASIVFRRHVSPQRLRVVPLEAQANPDSGAVRFLDGTRFEVWRPRLGYPALLFTELDAEAAFRQLEDDRDALHAAKPPGVTINEPREVGAFDPDVGRFLVVVEARTLAMDTLDSLTQREPWLPLYQTFRDFDADPAASFALELRYRDANVIDADDPTSYGDLAVSQAELDAGGALVLPTSRDLRLTLIPVCPDKPAWPAYFGFPKTRHGEELILAGEPFQFLVRQDATDETGFFRLTPDSQRLQALYLQPDPIPVVDDATFVAESVAGKEPAQSTMMQRLAAQLGLRSKGLTLIGKPGEHLQFGCSARVRHTLAPDASSLTFSSQADLVNHWLVALSFEIDRDWTWDGLADAGISIRRTRAVTGEPAAPEDATVGLVMLKKTASRVATASPDRSHTRIVFIDAIEPKKDTTLPATAAHPFPNTIDARYTLSPAFIPAVNAGAAARESAACDVRLPVTTIPAQAVTVTAAGFALSPYRRTGDYSATAVRQRFLWLELDQPVADPNDGLFARILTYAPDPLLTFPGPDQLLEKQDDAPMALDPELIRVVTTGQGNDGAGLDAMQPMAPSMPADGVPLEKFSPIHYLLPLPPGLHADSPELFGFFTYELRVGHTDRIWSTAQGRFGPPTRVNGVQHPAPALACLVDRTPDRLVATASHARAVFNGREVGARPPKTELWAMLYAQIRQSDGRGNRNLLLAEAKLEPVAVKVPELEEFLEARPGLPAPGANSLAVNLDAPAAAVATWPEAEIRARLAQLQLDPDVGLSVLAVEMMPRYDRFIVGGPAPDDTVRPLSAQLGQYRILRTSPLVAAPAVCCADC